MFRPPRVFGPVLSYDLVRTARQRRFFWLRAGYAVLMALVLLWIYSTTSALRPAASGLISEPELLSAMAQAFFYAFMIIQSVAVGVLTPALVGGAIATEKDRKTLPFLLATDLTNSEILFGKFLSRFGTLAMLVLAGLPILSAVQFLGGVEPALLLCGYAATLATLAGLASVSVLASVVSKRARDAIVLAYVIIIGYTLVTAILQAAIAIPGVNTPVTFLGVTVSFMDLIDAVSAGNLPVVVVQGAGSFARGGGFSAIAGPFRAYLIFHGVVTVACLAYSLWRMRALALRQAYGSDKNKSRRRGRRGRDARTVGPSPVYWKEAAVEGGLRLNALGQVAVLLIIAATVVPAGIAVYILIDRLPGGVNDPRFPELLGPRLNMWAAVAGSGASLMVLLGVAVKAANCVTGERDKDTLSSLLTTPLTARELLVQKWRGVLWGTRRMWIWPALIYLTALCGGGLSLTAALMLPVLSAAYAMAVAAVGVYFSVVARSTLRAVVYTVLTVVGIGGGVWLVFGCCCGTALSVGGAAEITQVILYTGAGSSPPAVMGMLTADEFDGELRFGDFGTVRYEVFVLLGFALWAGLALPLAARALEKFRRAANRDE